MTQTNTPLDPSRLHARYEQLLREARTAERYSNWQQSGRLRREARKLRALIDKASEKAA